jgi:hypothetical protein
MPSDRTAQTADKKAEIPVREEAEINHYHDPWPSGQAGWCDPPWILRGRALTAWFSAPWSAVEASMSPDLLPEHYTRVRSRLRFYNLGFEALGPPGGSAPAPRGGVFREGTVAFPCRQGNVSGEISAFLWSESEIYMLWAREVFGFPVRLAEIDLTGDIWESPTIIGSTGGARLTDALGTASIREVTVRRELQVTGNTGPLWFVPRRILQHAGPAREERQLLLVRPTVRQSGRRYEGTGRVQFQFTEEHPLDSLSGYDADIEVIDEIELVVGDDVEVLGDLR